MDSMNSMSMRYTRDHVIPPRGYVICYLHGNQTGSQGSMQWSDPSVYLNWAQSREEMAQSITTSQRSRTSKTLRGSSGPTQVCVMSLISCGSC